MDYEIDLDEVEGEIPEGLKGEWDWPMPFFVMMMLPTACDDGPHSRHACWTLMMPGIWIVCVGAGSFVNVGPALFERGGRPVKSWLDGDGQVRASYAYSVNTCQYIHDADSVNTYMQRIMQRFTRTMDGRGVMHFTCDEMCLMP